MKTNKIDPQRIGTTLIRTATTEVGAKGGGVGPCSGSVRSGADDIRKHHSSARIWLLGCLASIATLLTGTAQEFRITDLHVGANGQVEITYQSDTNGIFTLLGGPSASSISTRIASEAGRNGMSRFVFTKPDTNQHFFFRIVRENVLAPYGFLASPTDGTTLSFEGSISDSGAAEWHEHRAEAGDPVGGPTLTLEQRERLRSVLAEKQPNLPRSTVYDGKPTVSDDGSLVVKMLAQLDSAYVDSFATNGWERFEGEVIRFARNISFTAASDAAEPHSFLLQYSRSMTPKRRVRFLAELGKQSQQMQELMQAELWRLAVREREEGGWGYSALTVPSEATSLKSNALALLQGDSILNETNDARGHLSKGPEFREIAAALLWSVDGEDSRLNLIEFLIYLSHVAVPNGSIATHILGGQQGAITFESVVQPGYWLADSNHVREVRNLLFLVRWDVDQDAKLMDLESRVANLEARVGWLESWAVATDARLITIESAVTNLQARLAALEVWKETVDSRLAEIELRLDLIESLGVPYSGVPLPKKEDRDQDGIDDRVERLLIDAFAPVFMLGDTWRPPVSPEWFVQHCYLRGPGEDPDDPTRQVRSEWNRRRALWRNDPYRFIPEYERLVSEARERFPKTDETSWRLQFDQERFRDGASDLGDEMSWERARSEGNLGMYAHVVKGENAGEYIVQYFMLLTWNETSYSYGIGNHEGDWACVMLFIDLPEYSPQSEGETLLSPDGLRSVQQVLESPSRMDRVITARVCNHGRYIDTRGEKVDMVDVGEARGALRGGIKPRFWMERGTHELWPNSGGRGYSGWPGVNAFNSQVPPLWAPLSPLDSPLITESENHPNFKDGKVHDGHGAWVFGYHTKFRPGWILRDVGYRISFDFGAGEEWDDLNEHKVVREHRGEEGAYVTHSIPNLGEIGHETSKSAELVLRYRGDWGGWWKGNESPSGPWKEEMWISPSQDGARKPAKLDPAMRRQRAR